MASTSSPAHPSMVGTRHAQCAKECFYIKTLISRLQWTTVSPKVIETEKDKQKEELLSIEKAKKIPEK